MEYQTITEIIEALKSAKLVYNDADFCRKTGLQPSFVSEMKTGKKPFSDLSRRKIEETFPEFFAPKSVPIRPEELTLDEIHRSLIDHDVRFHETVNRILDAMGVSNKKVANE